MFDMDPFGGKKVPCTKMPQKLKKLNSPQRGLLRPPGVLNSPSPFLSLPYVTNNSASPINVEKAFEYQLNKTDQEKLTIALNVTGKAKRKPKAQEYVLHMPQTGG